MPSWYFGTKNVDFWPFWGFESTQGKPTSEAKWPRARSNLTILAPGWLLSWWLGGLVAHFLETLGACHRHFDGLGRFDVKMHGFKVPKSAHFDGFGVAKT